MQRRHRREAGLDGRPRQPDRRDARSSSRCPTRPSPRRFGYEWFIRRDVEPTGDAGRRHPRRSLRVPTDAEAWTHTALAQQVVFGPGRVREAPGLPCARSALAGSCSSPPRAGPPRPRATAARRRPRAFAGLDVRRGGHARAGARGAAGAPPGPPRRHRRRGLVRRGVVRRPGQGRLLLPRAGGGDARVPRHARPPRRAPHQHPHDLLRRRAHAVLRHDRPAPARSRAPAGRPARRWWWCTTRS